MNVFHLQTKNITSAALILGLASAFSGALGLLRDRLLAGRFGAGNELDVYYASFRIPDFISMVLIMGSISAAVIPIFSEYLTRDKEEAWKFLSNLFNLVLFILIAVSVVLIIFAPQIVNLITPGFSEEKRSLVVLLTRIMFLSPIILGTSNIISSVLQVFSRFLITSLAPIMYNFGIIIGILFFVPRWGLPGLAWGVVFGAFLHLLIQLPVLFKVGFKFKSVFDFGHLGFKKVVRLTVPRSIGLAASQFNFFIITAIASTLSVGSVAVFSLAESLARPFLILVGISFSTAAFPQLTLSFSKEKKERFFDIFFGTFSKIIFLIVPLSLILFFFRGFIVEIILNVGKFSQANAGLTAACLGMFALGLSARALNLFVVKGFYALQDTKTPAIISVLSMIITVSLSFLFVWLLSSATGFKEWLLKLFSLPNVAGIEIIGLPLALSLGAIFQFVWLYIIFQKKLRKFNLNE
ncbi:MAG: murein biosynthesis integral membrane protein MurJ [Candidatus Nealsonbacteria bacterium]